MLKPLEPNGYVGGGYSGGSFPVGPTPSPPLSIGIVAIDCLDVRSLIVQLIAGARW